MWGLLLCLGMLTWTNVTSAQIYDEISGICKLHPNYEYELEPTSTPIHLALARIFISEGGLDSTNDYSPIYQVLKNRSSGGRELTLNNMMNYSPYSFNYHSDHFARYIPYLNEEGEEPLFWRERYPNRSWEDFKDKWFRALRYAYRLAGGIQMRNVCRGQVNHWGADRPDMIEQALERGLVRVNCPGAKNAFWRIPR